MAVASSLLWIIGFALSVMIGPASKIWTWGPSMLCFAFATALILPGICKDGLGRLNLFIIITGALTTAWFAGRAWFTTAHELALMDLSLVAMSVSTFLVIQHSFRSHASQAIIVAGMALLLCANLAVNLMQLKDIEYNFIIPHEGQLWPRGFFRHYSHNAAFLIGSSLLLAGFSFKSSWHAVLRIALLLIAIAGLVTVFYTKSRGAMIGAGCGVAILIFYWALSVRHNNKKWSSILLISTPFLLFASIFVAIHLLQNVQETREEGGNLIGMLDNNFRLYMYGIAASCIGLHPFIGGGSRSFSWECYRFWDTEQMGHISADPGHVHNELVQVFTDYGIIGALLLMTFIIGICILCTFRTSFNGSWSKHPLADAWRIGGIAAFVGIFIHSNFEGILRIAPGAILLAICLAAAAHGWSLISPTENKRFYLHKCMLILCCVAMTLITSFYGWKGTSVIKDFWTACFSKDAIEARQKIQGLSKGLEKWQLESVHQERGMAQIDLAFKQADPNDYRTLVQAAVEDYKAAALLHPNSPLYQRNTANALRIIDEHDAAKGYFERAIELQGGMECLFNTNYFYARSLYVSANRAYLAKQFDLSIQRYESAQKHLNLAIRHMHGVAYNQLELSIQVNLASALQKTGKFAEALDYFDAAALLADGSYARHLSAAMLTQCGIQFNSKKRYGDALRLFVEAKNRLDQSHSIAPTLGEQNRNFLKVYLEASIHMLSKDYKPSENLVFE